MKEKGWGIERVKKHQDFDKKYCPHRTLDMGWERFLNMVKAELEALNAPKVVTGVITGVDAVRETNALILYKTGTNGKTNTNKWGTEVALDKNFNATANPVCGVGNMAIPKNGYVLSGHGKNSDWLLANIKKGTKVSMTVKVQ